MSSGQAHKLQAKTTQPNPIETKAREVVNTYIRVYACPGIV